MKVKLFQSAIALGPPRALPLGGKTLKKEEREDKKSHHLAKERVFFFSPRKRGPLLKTKGGGRGDFRNGGQWGLGADCQLSCITGVAAKLPCGRDSLFLLLVNREGLFRQADLLAKSFQPRIAAKQGQFRIC